MNIADQLQISTTLVPLLLFQPAPPWALSLVLKKSFYRIVYSSPHLFIRYSRPHKNMNIFHFPIAMAWFHQTFLLSTIVHYFII